MPSRRPASRYRGWLANFCAPETFARHRLTVHVPRRAYVRGLPGIPTIRVFEALACGIPLICAPWEDREGLFRPGQDYLVASDGIEMRAHMTRLLEDPEAAAAQAERGLERVRARHTCAHRVDELLALVDGVGSLDEHRLLRQQPRLGLLERRVHVLPGDDPGPGGARARRDLL